MSRLATAAPLLGAHMSIGGGLHRALERGAAAGCGAVQLFTKPNRNWRARPLTDEDLVAWEDARRRTGVVPAMAHAAYLINVGSPDRAVWTRSRDALVDEYARCGALGIPLLVLHPGAHMGAGEAPALARIAQAVREVLEGQPDNPTVLLFENMAGQGTNVGHRLEHLRDLLGLVDAPKRTAVCLDTCHLHAAGYAIDGAARWREALASFDRVIGRRWLRAFHLNDSKRPAGARVDRHEAIGRGTVGLHAFRCLLADPKLARLPMAIETPKPSEHADPVNLAVLRALVGRQRLTPTALRLAEHPLDRPL